MDLADETECAIANTSKQQCLSDACGISHKTSFKYDEKVIAMVILSVEELKFCRPPAISPKLRVRSDY